MTVTRLTHVILPTRTRRLSFARRLRSEMAGRPVTAANLAALVIAFALFVWMAS